MTWTQRTRDPPPAAETESARARLGTFLQSRHTSQVTFRHNVTMSRTRCLRETNVFHVEMTVYLVANTLIEGGSNKTNLNEDNDDSLRSN